MSVRIPNRIFIVAGLVVLSACARLEPEPFEPSAGHIQVVAASADVVGIPELVRQPPVLPVPVVAEEPEKYTVVVNEVPVRELLFALARDADVDMDIDSAIAGMVTMNAVERTLPQLLDRIARQAALRYELQGRQLLILPDVPFFRSYQIDYIDMSRSTSSNVESASQIESAVSSGSDAVGGGGGGSGNSSSIKITSEAMNAFWSSLIANVTAIIGDDASGGDDGQVLSATQNVIAYPEAGLLTVRASGRQHKLVQALIDNALQSANRQVMIQTSIIEVNLSDDYQAGIDWAYLAKEGKAGFSLASGQGAVNQIGAGIPSGSRSIDVASTFRFEFFDPNPDRDRVSFAVQLLEQFGDVRVLSSPQIMALNNQTALLQVVDNVVYFRVEQETNTTQGVAVSSYETTPRTVPVGITMSITPRINSNGSVILNVRPSISRITGFVKDPNPSLNVENQVPQIRVRQMESMLRLNNNQIGVLGGLMQNETRGNTDAVPGLSELPGLGAAFENKRINQSKTELVIFLRPVIVSNPSLDGDLRSYKQFIKTN
ncbi:MAG: pilus (MSHA type) biogenesis protein MshL [Gammaproteobacteria bacterium]